MNHTAFGVELMHLLGLDPDEVWKVAVESQTGKPDQIKVWSLRQRPSGELVSRTQRYTLVPLEVPG